MKSQRPASASASITTAATFGSRCNYQMKDCSMTPKVTMYRTDGYGRDTYINYDNGGFRRNMQSNYRTIYIASYLGRKTTAITPKFALYKIDGQGRDSYINTDCGGFYQTTTVQTFPSLLRSYDGFKLHKKNDYMNYSNRYKTVQANKEQNELRKQQRLKSAKLSKPKLHIRC